MPVHRALALRPFLDPCVAGIAEGNRLLAVQEVMRLRHIGDICGGANHGVHQAAFGIDTNVGFHAEVPLIALARLMHLRVTFLRAVLGRARRRDDRGVDDRALPQHQPLSSGRRAVFPLEVDFPTSAVIRGGRSGPRRRSASEAKRDQQH
jgi:hypothetical protein